MKTMLVTGGAGFIGSNFIRFILGHTKNIRVINLDKLTYAGNLENLKDIETDIRYTFIKSDICNSEEVSVIFKEFDIDHVINFAAESHVDRSIIDPELFVRTNVLGTLTLLNTAKQFWENGSTFKQGRKFIQISTDEVYGSLGEKGFFTETTPLNPRSPYSASKAAADMLVKSYYWTYKMPVNITRCSNNYGPYQFPEKLIPLIINNAVNKRPLPIYGDGLNIRDWLYVEDHCIAIERVLEFGVPGQVYNIGGNNERANIDIVSTIIGHLAKKLDPSINEGLIRYVADRKGHDRRYAIDASKIKTELGWEPLTCFDEGIRKTISWYLENNDWMKNVTSGDYQKYYKNLYGEKVC